MKAFVNFDKPLVAAVHGSALHKLTARLSLLRTVGGTPPLGGGGGWPARRLGQERHGTGR